ncbi:MAG: polysaccharide deacetylase family protein [Salinivirgaceae bacterium]|jgi:peptidoglycan/xylan/chitin deacetylase (PgdA/CDA1 family)
MFEIVASLFFAFTMNIHRPPKWLRALYYSVDWKITDQSNSLFLTFDDGPTPEVTEWVLEQLDLFNAKATFFCIGRNVEHYPDIYSKIIEKGHAVGNHTYSHLKGWKTPTEEYINDVELASQFIRSNLFRPPYGRIRRKQIKKLKALGYRLYMWDVLSEDYNAAIGPEKCLEYVMKYTEAGSIIVFHDSVKASKNLYAVLPAILKYYKEKGFVFRELK